MPHSMKFESKQWHWKYIFMLMYIQYDEKNSSEYIFNDKWHIDQIIDGCIVLFHDNCVCRR